MDWFERLTGFAECGYEQTRQRLSVVDGRLVSSANGRSHCVGRLELVSLAELRQRVEAGDAPRGKASFGDLRGDVRQLHRDPAHAGALFQVASQFNLLEMVGPKVNPEDGVTRYRHDPTQGPACAIAAGAATVYRNYFAPVDGVPGQTRDRQFNGLADLGHALGHGEAPLWDYRNGYALCTQAGLARIRQRLDGTDEAGLDRLRGLLRIGLHWDVEVTDAEGEPRPVVSQAFCSALPVAYSRVPAAQWSGFATLVLEAAYEATLLAAVLNARRGASRQVLLTRLGGGAFGNQGAWIDGAIRRAQALATGWGIDVLQVQR